MEKGKGKQVEKNATSTLDLAKLMEDLPINLTSETINKDKQKEVVENANAKVQEDQPADLNNETVNKDKLKEGVENATAKMQENQSTGQKNETTEEDDDDDDDDEENIAENACGTSYVTKLQDMLNAVDVIREKVAGRSTETQRLVEELAEATNDLVEMVDRTEQLERLHKFQKELDEDKYLK